MKYTFKNYSQFTLGGHTFPGGGVDLTPGIFRFGFVYGRFNRAIAVDTLSKAFQAWYEYSLEAVDDAGLHSPKSFPLNVRVYDSGKRPSISDFTVVKSQDGKSLVLNWKYNGEGNYWFVIFKSVNGKDFMTYKNLSADQHSFTDTSLKKGVYQYSVKAMYKDGGESQLIKSAIIDFLPFNGETH